MWRQFSLIANYAFSQSQITQSVWFRSFATKPSIKRATSAFGYYMKEASAKLKEEGGKLSIGERQKRLAQQWKELPADEKAKFEKLAQEDKERAASQRQESKRAPSAFGLFVKETASEFAGLKFAERMAKITERWKALDPEKKKALEQMSQKLKDEKKAADTLNIRIKQSVKQQRRNEWKQKREEEKLARKKEKQAQKQAQKEAAAAPAQ